MQGFFVAAIWSPTLEAASEAGAALDVPFATNKVSHYLYFKKPFVIYLASNFYFFVILFTYSN